MKNNYNERSWAIDVITQINLIVSQRKKVIRKAGGERTLKASTKSSSLFPDVLLFQDEQSARVLQGWELKMPDTPITDAELLINAEKKARLLGLNSFLVWNVSEAALYVLNAGKYEHRAQWSDLKDITKRDEVEANEGRWVAQLTQIIEDLEQFFNNGDIKSQNILEALSENKIIDVITGNIGLVKQNIISALQKDAHLDALVTEWWETIKIEYSSEPDAPSAVAKLVLMTWVNRFLFAHYLKKFTDKALQIDDFNEGTTLADAKVYFSELTAESDFLNVYAPVIGEDLIDAVSWEQILQLNLFLSELNLKDIDQGLLQQFFEQLLLTSKRKAAGQYATPYSLADYFTRIVVLDKTLPMIDPFCGTGTILRAVYDLKVEAGVSPLDTISSIWGSDKFSFPLQMSTISLAKPEVMGQVLNIFKSDVIDLEIAKSYDFIDPNNGNTVTKQLPGFDYIISNLPFVKGADIGKANPNIFGIIKKIANLLTEPNFAIPAKSDLIAYLPYYLWHLCNDKGRVGLIVSNSWLGTDWGEQFRTRLNRFFKIEKIVTSGNGKWFQNAAVVTNLIVLEKRAVPIAIAADEEETSFITMNVSVDELADKATVQKAARETILRRNGLVKVRTWTKAKMSEFDVLGLSWSAFFADLSWIDKAQPKLIKANTLFDINRGERRGWDDMFLPTGNHGIEPEYIKPVLKNFKDITHLIGKADAEAFCCSKTLGELEAANATGALAWIKKFENGVNDKGLPLTTSLRRANHHWYEMKDTTVADLVGTINYGSTLFIAKLEQRSFVNQRLIRFTVKRPETDIDLCQALMNSFLGIFYIEALGFGRGQGALDLNSTKVRDNLFMLNPALLTADQKEAIKAAFAPLFAREIEHVPDEVDLADRIAFEQVVAEAFDLVDIWPLVKASLLDLFNIRETV